MTKTTGFQHFVLGPLMIDFLAHGCERVKSCATRFPFLKTSFHEKVPLQSWLFTLPLHRHSGAVLHRSQWQPDGSSSGEEGHRLVDGQARQVQEPRRQRKPLRGFPRWFEQTVQAASQLTRQQFLYSDQHILCFFFRHQQAGELEEASVRAGRVGSRQQRFHQRGPDRVDANGCPADLSQAVPHHPEEAQHGADAAQRQLHPERHIQYPLARGHKLKTVELIVSALILRHESSSRCVLVLHVKAQKMEVVKRKQCKYPVKVVLFQPHARKYVPAGSSLAAGFIWFVLQRQTWHPTNI